MTVISISQPAASPASPKVVRGRGLFACKLSKAQRAVLGAEVKEGAVVLTDMSARQIAAVVGVSPGYITAALKASPLHREAVRRGLRPLVEPHVKAEPHAKAGPQERLSAIVDEIGLDRTFNLLNAFEITNAA